MQKEAKAKLLERPVEEVIEETKEELKDFADIDGNVDFAKAVDEINENLEKQKTNTRSRKKKDFENE